MSGPVLHTDRLILRLPEASDCAAFVAYSVSDRTRFVGGPRLPLSAIEKFAGMIGHWALRGYGRFTITDRASGAPLGHVGPTHFDLGKAPELTWTLWSAEAEGRGIASEAALRMADWLAQDLRWDMAVTSIHHDNIGSQKIARRIGGTPTGAPAPHLADAALWHFPLAARAAHRRIA